MSTRILLISCFCLVSTCFKLLGQTVSDSLLKSIELDVFDIISKTSPVGSLGNQEYILKMSAIERLPQMLGSTDPIKSFQLLPGIQTMSEGGLYIEGCNTSHNLILLDGASIFNPIHLGGLFSVFNADHLNDFVLKKNYISSEYGSCLAGVLTAKSNTEIPNKLKLDANISLMVSNATAIIPLNKKSVLSISGRVSYIKPILEIVNSFLSTKANLSYSFYDFNLTYFYKHLTNEMKLSLYTGNDDVRFFQKEFVVDANVNWLNLVGSLDWKKKINKWNELSHVVYYSGLNDELSVSLGGSNISLLSNIKKIGYKNKYNVKFNNLDLLLGSEYIHYFFVPQYLSYSDFGVYQQEQKQSSSEIGVFGECEYEFNSKLKTKLGVRLSGFFYRDSLSENLNHVNPEPRFNIKYKISKTCTLDFTLQHQVQYVNQVMTSAIGFPSDFWVMTSDYIPYQESNSYIFNITKTTKSYNYEFASNFYFRELTNQFESSGYLTDLFTGKMNQLGRFTIGKGNNYGCEFLVKKNSNRLTGWLSYTLSWAWRIFDEIEQSTTVPALSDRRHVINVVSNYAFSSKWDLSACFVFASGVPSTFSKGIYVIGEMAVNQYPEYNSNRLPSHHRLDISVTRTLKLKYFKSSKLNFSVYNVYARENPFLLTSALLIDSTNQSFKIKRYNHSLYSILPSIGIKISL